MKDKILFISNTYFQLLTAIQLSMTEFKNFEVDFLISDHSINAMKIVENMENTNIGGRVYYIESKNISFSRNKKEQLTNLLKVIHYKKTVKSIINLNFSVYCCFLFHNMDLFLYALFQKMKRDNPKLHIYRYEEGFSLYLYFNDKIKSERVCERIFPLMGGKSLRDSIEKIYLYHPEYLTYNIQYPIKKISPIDKHNFRYKEVVNKVFEYTIFEEISEKFIIFEDCFFGDGHPINDYNLFLEIADAVGAYGTTIKLHPRNGTNRFKGTKCRALETSSIPWEVIQMNNNYLDKVFLTVASGSVLASMLYFNEAIPTIFLYKVVGGKFKTKKNYTDYLEKICNNSNKTNVYIPETKEELFELIEKLKR